MAALRGDISFRYLKQFFLVLPVLSGHLSSGFPYMVKTIFKKTII
jgi:hypothetical protein